MKNKLLQTLSSLSGPPQSESTKITRKRRPTDSEAAAADSGNNKRPDREGKAALIAYVNLEGVEQLKILAAKSRRTQQDLLKEAVNDLLSKYHYSPLA